MLSFYYFPRISGRIALTPHHKQIPVCVYHGTREDRAELRRTVLRPIDPNDEGVDKDNQEAGSTDGNESGDTEENDEDLEEDDVENVEELGRGKRKRIPSSRISGRSIFDSAASSKTSRKINSGQNTKGRSRRHQGVPDKHPISLLSSDEEDGTHKFEGDQEGDEDFNPKPWTKAKSRGKFKPSNASHKTSAKRKTIKRKQPIEYQPQSTFPVVITTYEIIIKDRKFLGSNDYDWGYIVVDEGHRLKNLNCKLVKEIKQYKSACRLILTGTPLHVRYLTFFF